MIENLLDDFKIYSMDVKGLKRKMRKDFFRDSCVVGIFFIRRRMGKVLFVVKIGF